MTEKKRLSKRKIPETVAFAIKLFSVVLLAFAAALLFRRSVGIISMFPLAFLLCAVATFIDIKPSYKIIIFVATVFSINTIEQSDINITLTYTTLCLLAAILAEYSASKIKNKKKSGFIIAVVGATLLVALSFTVIGNPFSAIGAERILTEYVNEKYPDSEDAVLGEFEFSNVFYNNKTKAYSIDAVSSKFPTESAVISVSGGNIRDSFKLLMESKIKEPYESDFTSFLRKILPTDSFSVTCKSIASGPDDNILTSKSGELKKSVNYEVHLGGIQTADEMIKRVSYYMSLLDRSNAEYNTIVFKSGTGPFVRRCIEIDRSRQKFQNDYQLKYVPAGIIGDYWKLEFVPPDID